MTQTKCLQRFECRSICIAIQNRQFDIQGFIKKNRKGDILPQCVPSLKKMDRACMTQSLFFFNVGVDSTTFASNYSQRKGEDTYPKLEPWVSKVEEEGEWCRVAQDEFHSKFVQTFTLKTGLKLAIYLGKILFQILLKPLD